MRLEGKKIAVLLAEGFEDLEYWVTVMRLQEEGAEVVTVGPNKEEVSGKNALTAQAEATADEVDETAPRPAAPKANGYWPHLEAATGLIRAGRGADAVPELARALELGGDEARVEIDKLLRKT